LVRSLPPLKRYVNVYHSPSFRWTDTLNLIQGLQPVQVTSPADTRAASGILLVDKGLLQLEQDLTKWHNPYEADMICIVEDGRGDGEYLVPEGWPERFTTKALEAALAEWTLRLSRRTLRKELNSEHSKIAQLTSIAQDLSAETDLDALLTKILSQGRMLVCCDAASIFLIDKEKKEEPELVFKWTQNDSIHFPFEEKRFPLDKTSIAGFVAVTGEIYNTADAYISDPASPITFNRSFDELMNYRTRSIISIPMKNHEGDIIGVLQFLNRKTSYELKLSSVEITEKHTLPFSEEQADLLMALASQAAIAIENATLISQIRKLFEGFVKASVTAIEQRDPTTSGHSFRVANLTVALARALPRSGRSRFANERFSEKQIREIRYASLLHDFGKVGVREHVLVKSHKLPENGLDQIRLRFAVFKEQLARRNTQQRLDYVLAHGRQAYKRVAAEMDAQLKAEWDRFEQFYLEIVQANEPTILPEGRFNHLEVIRDLSPFQVGDVQEKLLTEDEFLALSVKKGSLTHDERKEIESHVKHTFDFLSRIPWTPDLKNAPEIAYAHHEKLNGTGYPRGLDESQIPLPSKMMAVSDIYDALTASDRPYKPAIPVTRALSILEAEAKRGLLDMELVEVFVEAAIFGNSEDSLDIDPEYAGFDEGFIKRNVCDYELPQL
jgi:HD-GYP domain-containing protein (c-di-GMP phosphodiesterase class II)